MSWGTGNRADNADPIDLRSLAMSQGMARLCSGWHGDGTGAIITRFWEGEAMDRSAAYTAFADLNGDGRILTLDVNATKARLNDILPAALPAAAALFSDSRIADEVLA